MNTTSPSKRAGLDYYPAFFSKSHCRSCECVLCHCGLSSDKSNSWRETADYCKKLRSIGLTSFLFSLIVPKQYINNLLRATNMGFEV